ncbi:MAG: FtsK/SpoIIIE domain-containing protein, partial [Gammaproteobacteria bacterium]|nr:FtsK/SpoIIIE domain-containing protein [Gammaproteobacteria bacterium]
SATSAKDKAVGQVQSTQNLLQKRLAGSAEPLDAPFRNKQLSLLIKAQLEQAVAMGVYSRDVYEYLNVPALSSNLATGRYAVDYTIAHEGRHLWGDAFLLHTAGDTSEAVQVEVIDGVRVITVPRKLVEWLAFELDDSPTLLGEPQRTFPRLGRYTTVETEAGASSRRMDTRGSTPLLDLLEAQTSSVAMPAVEANVVGPAFTSVQPATEEGFGELELAGGPSLEEASLLAIKKAPYPDAAVADAVLRLEKALVGHKVHLTSPPSLRETDLGPRLIRVYTRLAAGESINAVRRISEDIARVVGTTTSDIHITNVPERHAVGLDLPLPGLTYAVSFEELLAHPSFDAAQRALRLGFCAGIDVTGRPVWIDLAAMPHMLVAGTTGSGKTVFLRNLVLTLLLNNSPRELVLRLSSSKPMDFRVFTQAPHCQGREMARDPAEALRLASDLVVEMERRYQLIEGASCETLAEYNTENRARQEPYIVAVFDEYAEMIASFAEK